MRTVFFDLDRTLISKNSASLWLKAELRAGVISHLQALRAAAWLLRYHLGTHDIADALRASIRYMAGSAEAELVVRTDAFFGAEMRRLYRPGALLAIASHRRAGDHLALLTSSTSYLANPVAHDLSIDGVLCNRLEVGADGRFTGAPIEPLCYGAGKVQLAERYLQSLGRDFDSAVFYSDSATDLPMLEAVGRPVAVNPDPRLRWVAMRRRWPIVDWGQGSALQR